MRTRTLLALLMALSLVAAACGGSDASEGATDTGGDTDSGGEASVDAVKAAWIFVGPINDGGWTTAHNEGRESVEAAMGDKVITTYKENVPEGPEAAQVIEDLIADGNQIIFAASFGYGDAMAEAAEKHPDVKFEWATGIPNDLPNFATYFGAGEESLYLSGMAAGAATESNIIGFVAPFPIPEVVRHINAYALGAQEVNPDAVVRVVWVNSWFDPPKERQAAESLIGQGADVIASGGDSPAPGEAARDAGVGWTGYDSDQSTNFPEVWLTAAIYDWGPYYTGQVEGVLNGDWKGGDYYGNIADGFTDIAPFGKLVSSDTQATINERSDQIVDGSFDIFAGPISDQDGTEQVAEGASMDFGVQMSIDWFVAGVEGSAGG